MAFDTHDGLAEEKAWIIASKTDIGAFEPLYKRYHQEIYRFIFRRTDSATLAEDLCANTFYTALRHIKRYEFRGKPFGHWLYRIARNEVNLHFRDKQPVYVIDYQKVTEPLGIDHEEGQTVESKLRYVFSHLDESDIQFIELKFFESLTFKELGIRLGQGESAVKMRHYRLLDKMKNILKKGYEED
ncbi:MAG: sigma-70 family RNA polymerase sigma factor [Bacteroidota bacterium]